MLKNHLVIVDGRIIAVAMVMRRICCRRSGVAVRRHVGRSVGGLGGV